MRWQPKRLHVIECVVRPDCTLIAFPGRMDAADEIRSRPKRLHVDSLPMKVGYDFMFLIISGRIQNDCTLIACLGRPGNTLCF